MRFPTRFFCLLAFLASLAATQSLPRGDDAFLPEKLAAIKPRMQSFVDDGSIPGAVSMIVKDGKVAHLEAVGFADIEARKPMRTDTIFQIMSMTKPITGIGVMILMEEGKLSIHDPVERYLPEFQNQWMVAARDGRKEMTLVRPSRPITLLDLLTHTSGMSGGMPEGMRDFLSKMDRPLGEAVAAYAQVPLQFEPGSRWMYSNMGIDTLGRIIEVASGMKYEDFLKQRIFDPLGMKDSFFYPPAEKQGRIAMLYGRRNGKWQKEGADSLGGDPGKFRAGAKYPGPSFGLYSTAEDLSLVTQMMLNGGTLNGKRILSPATVKMMTTLQNGRMEPSGHNTGQGYGLAWTVAKDPRFEVILRPKGTYGHGGAFGTDYWVDPEHQLIGIFMIQISTGDRHEEKVLSQMAVAALK